MDFSLTPSSIIRNWYPETSTKILKMLDKLAPPKLDTSTPETYLEVPEDSSEFTIGVSADDEDRPDSDSSESEYLNNALDSDEEEKEDL